MTPGLAQWVKDSALLWLWRRPTAATKIQPLAWEAPYASGVALGKKKKKERERIHSEITVHLSTMRQEAKKNFLDFMVQNLNKLFFVKEFAFQHNSNIFINKHFFLELLQEAAGSGVIQLGLENQNRPNLSSGSTDQMLPFLTTIFSPLSGMRPYCLLVGLVWFVFVLGRVHLLGSQPPSKDKQES